MRLLYGVLSVVSLITCAMIAFFYFWGSITMPEYKAILLAASIVYFIFATLWATRPSNPAS
jgi:hypothetical protein